MTQATGTAEREVVIDMVEALGGTHRVTVGADATPHVAQAIDGRTTRHEGYSVSQRFRKRIEECFCWAKTIGGMREKSRFVGRQRLDFQFALTMTADNQVRMRNLGLVSYQ